MDLESSPLSSSSVSAKNYQSQMDSCEYPAVSDDIDNMDEDDQDIQEEDSHCEPETGNTKEGEGRGTKTKSKAKKKKVKVQRSWVWGHYTRLKDNSNKCKCHYCERVMKCLSTSGTSNLKKHLTTCDKYKVCIQSENQRKLDRSAGDGSVKFGRVSEYIFKEACNELLVLAELPLSFIESLAWRHFCFRMKLYKPHSRRTATREIVKMYVKKKEEMRNLIGQQRVSLTTDIWVAPSTGASYMVITAHWIDASWCLKKLIIGFKNIADHKGKTIASVLIDCLASWRIKKIFTITVDNATANTLALGKFKEKFQAIGNDSLVLGGQFLHMRCAAHIINLVVKDGLKEVDSSVVAICNGVSYVRSSTERLNSFELRVDHGKMSRGSIPLDVKTRWNSTYLMLTRALKFRLAFDKMKAEDKVYTDWFTETVNGVKRIGPPTQDDWEEIERLVEFLRIFYISTLVVSASETVNSYKCYSEIVTIERNLMMLSQDQDEAMREKASVMKAKFDKYWDGLKEINKLIIVASTLDPTNKMCFATMCFEELYGNDSWQSKDLELTVNQVMSCLFAEYSTIFGKPRSIDLLQSHSQTQSQSTISHSGEVDMNDLEDGKGRYERINFVYKRLIKEKGIQQSGNELELYLTENVENPEVVFGTEFDVLSWWRLNAPKYPILSEIAKDVFAMQISSVASESAFSTSGRVLDPYRSCLTHYTIEVLMCTEQWLKSGINIRERKGETTTQQILDEITLQDQLEKEFNTSSLQDN